MVTLLSSLLLGASLAASSGDMNATSVPTKVAQQTHGKRSVPRLPGANQHVRQWPGTSGDGRVGTLNRPEVGGHRKGSGNSIPPVSTVTLLQGWTVQNYTDAQWQSLFQGLANQGIKSVVFASSVDENEGAGQVLGTPNAYPAATATAWYPVSSLVTTSYPNVSYSGNATGASRSPVDECLYYAQHNGVNNSMTVYVGLNFYADEWGFRSGNINGSGYIDPITDSSFCASEAKLATLVASDLNNQFGGYSSFAGWYWPWEVDNIYFDKNIGDSQNSFLPTGYAASAYANLISMLETSYFPLSAKPRLISPFFNPYYQNTVAELPYQAYTASEYGTLWQQIFSTVYQGSSLFTSKDIFAPQDGAGDYLPQISGSSSLQGPPSAAAVQSIINTWYPPLLQAAANIYGMQVWANADTYQIDVEAIGAPAVYVENDPAYPTSPWVDGAFVSAGISRIAAQFQAEASVTYAGTYRVSQIMNCSNAYYDDPIAVWSNSAWGSAWKTWQVNQSVGLSGAPSIPTSTGPTNANGHCALTLTVASSPNGVCGFNIWRDSYTAGTTPYVCCEIPISSGSATTFTDPDANSNVGNHTYYVVAYDVFGNQSSVAQFAHSGSVRVSLNKSSVAGGTSLTGTVTLASAAPSGGTTFSLSADSVNVSVPTTVTVAPGSTKVSFSVTTTSVSASTTANVIASTGNNTQSATFTITADTVSSISVSPSTIYGGSNATGSVTLGTVAGPQGIVVHLSSNTACAKVSSTVTVASGATSTTFVITTTGVSGYTTVAIAASIGSSIQTQYIGVVPAGVLSVSLSSNSVVGGTSSTGTVTLNGLAGPGGEVVTLVSNSGLATVQTTVTVPGGSKSATFSLKTNSVATTTSATITAGADYVYASAVLTIRHS